MTDSNEKPLSPNYVPDVGRLVTDRFDFQKHVDGAAFRHLANQIDLSPTLVINSTTYTEVQDALAALAILIGPPAIPQATIGITTANLGIITLGGDLSGNSSTALIPKVSGIQGHPISTNPPAIGNVLTWNGSSWSPQASAGSVSFSGDITGTPSGPQSVVSLTGTTNTVVMKGNFLSWVSGTSPVINQSSTVSSSGSNFTVAAQTSFSGTGGDLVLAGGGGGINQGGVNLSDGIGNYGVQVGKKSTTRYVALSYPSAVTPTQLPSGVGDLITLVGNTATAPTVGSPAGPILYGLNGQLWVMQSDATTFQVGSIPNPSVWGITGGPYNTGTPPAIGTSQEYTYRISSQTTTNSPQITHFTLPGNTAARIDVIAIGKQAGTANSAQYNLSLGFVTDGSDNVTLVGTLTSADPRFTGGASGWTAPLIDTIGTAGGVRVYSGWNAATTINWTIVSQFVLVTG